MRSLCYIFFLIIFFNSKVLYSQNMPENRITIFTIGDSTMANKKADVAPETGWCMVLQNFFDNGIVVKNRAMNGRSSKSFITEGRWKAVMDSLRQGDYVFIQFGHNDQKSQDSSRFTEPYTSYYYNLQLFVKQTRDKGANPILFTSIERRKFEKGFLIDSHGNYSTAVRKLAFEMNVPMVDLHLLTSGAISAIGEDDSKNIYLWTAANQKFPEGRQDNTHLSSEGALFVAKLAIQSLLSFDNSLQKHINK